MSSLEERVALLEGEVRQLKAQLRALGAKEPETEVQSHREEPPQKVVGDERIKRRAMAKLREMIEQFPEQLAFKESYPDLVERSPSKRKRRRNTDTDATKSSSEGPTSPTLTGNEEETLIKPAKKKRELSSDDLFTAIDDRYDLRTMDGKNEFLSSFEEPSHLHLAKLLDINNDLRLLNKFLKDGSDDTSQDLLDAPVMDFSSKKELHLLGRFIDIVSQADLSPSFRYAREFRTSLKTVYQRTKDKKLTEVHRGDLKRIIHDLKDQN
jgi:hypothetical protein